MALAGNAFAACRPDRLEVKTPIGRTAFDVEIADSAAERALGLMNRPKMAPTSGMLFVYDKASDDIAFWMKNTLIPLDIIFLNSEGRVMRVHEMAKPHDLTPLPGGRNIQYVLEINGGLAKQYKIVPGALIRHPAIANPAWPC